MSTIAFIGLGIMGGPMARHLLAAGHRVIGYNRSRGPVERLVGDGGTGADSSPASFIRLKFQIGTRRLMFCLLTCLSGL